MDAAAAVSVVPSRSAERRRGRRGGRGCGDRRAEGGRGGRSRRGRCLRRYGGRRRGRRGREGRWGEGGGLGRGLGRLGRFLLRDLAAEVLQQRVEAAVEALADRREPPDVLEVEVAEHHRAFGGELRAVEGVPRDLLAAGDDPQVAGGDLRHPAVAVDRRGEGQLLDLRRDTVQGHPEGFRVPGLLTEELDGLLGGLRLVEEDEVPVVREPFVGVQSEAADVEGQAGRRDLYPHVQIRPRRQIADLGLVAALEFPGHVQRPSPTPECEFVRARLTAGSDIAGSRYRPGTRHAPRVTPRARPADAGAGRRRRRPPGTRARVRCAGRPPAAARSRARGRVRGDAPARAGGRSR
ncbi:hypothetical protein Saa2_09096 [Streptomyces acidiscabies]|nr:hypothetical protein Saa2_09096 [Streptomyces acidiscabies]